MTAQYKLRTKTTETNRGMVHVTIQLEKHLFIDSAKFTTLRDAADGVEGVENLLDGSGGIAQILAALGPERPPAGMLGLETDWQPVSEFGAETLIEKYYAANPEFSVCLQGDARNGSLLIVAGRASMAVGLSPAQAAADKAKLEELARYCEAHPPQNETQVHQAVESVVGVAGQTSAIITVGETCLMGGTIGVFVGGAIACIGSIALAIGGFIGWVGALQKQQRDDNEMRDRERVCGFGPHAAGGPAMDRMMDRIGRTC